MLSVWGKALKYLFFENIPGDCGAQAGLGHSAKLTFGVAPLTKLKSSSSGAFQGRLVDSSKAALHVQWWSWGGGTAGFFPRSFSQLPDSRLVV